MAVAAAAAMVASSAYYSISAPKAELLIKMKDMQEQTVELDSEEELEEENDTELANKKVADHLIHCKTLFTTLFVVAYVQHLSVFICSMS